MRGADCTELRQSRSAGVRRIGTARREGTARRQIGRIGHKARYGFQPRFPVPDIWQGVKQRFRIRMSGPIKNVLQRSLLHDSSRVHHRHLIACLRNDSQIMGNQDHGSTVLFLEIVHEIQYLGLDGHIQGGSGLICNQKLGIAGQCDGNDHPLAHPPAELVWILSSPAARNSHQLQHLPGLLIRFGLRKMFMNLDTLRNLIPNGKDRIQGCHRILKDHRDLLASDFLQLTAVEFQNGFTADLDAALLNHSRRIRHQL